MVKNVKGGSWRYWGTWLVDSNSSETPAKIQTVVYLGARHGGSIPMRPHHLNMQGKIALRAGRANTYLCARS